jgi:exonuclease SbcC
MIPLQLRLKNFFSYRDAVLDFRGLHTACICGSNGAGKSSLLEAITWVIWGQSRAASEDDVIHAGEKDVRVDFTFQNNQQTYRLIRTRNRGQSSSLEFQVESGGKFRSLTGRGVRATQQLITAHLKLDYDTFINSAYLRQGRADEFMLRRPSDRKQILADLLKLNQYEDLADQAKDLSRQFKGQAEQLEQSLQTIEEQLQQREAIATEQTATQAVLEQLQQLQQSDRQKLDQLQILQNQRSSWQQQLSFVRQQDQSLRKDCDRLQQDITATAAQQQQLEARLSQTESISAGYQDFTRLQAEEEAYTAKFQDYQETQQHSAQLQQQLTRQINELNLQIRQTQAQLDALKPQEQEILDALSRSDEIAAAIEQLQHHRQRLDALDNLQLQVSPLLQRRSIVQTALDRAQARLSAKLEELQSSEKQLNAQIASTPQLRQTVLQVEAEIGQLEKKRVYQQRVQEKGLERRNFKERLQENQRGYENQTEELTSKLEILQTQNAICPLCEHPLDDDHGKRVIEKTLTQQQEIQGQIWVVREQLAVCDRELQVLRHEYSQLTQELAPYEELLEQRGQLAARLDVTDEVYDRLYEISEEKTEIERSLTAGNYALDLQQELQQLEEQLQELDYNEQTHALIRGEVERWRWAEIARAKIEDATKRRAQLAAQKPKLTSQIDSLTAALHQLQTNSQLQQQIASLEAHLVEIDYNLECHNTLRAALRKAQAWQLQYQELLWAQQQYPQVEARQQQLQETLQTRQKEREATAAQLEMITQQLEQSPDTTAEIEVLQPQIQQRRQQLDEQLSQLGRLQQRFTQLEALQTQYDEQQQQLQDLRRQYRVHHELTQAFGKNGIQALMIENILPQLEAETNQILSRLTGNQLHVQIITQKAGKRASKKSTKLIDTLDILIADASGTRPYETYSGGEAFRINFSIRLALAKLLAQRAGTSLQLLIVDEGFGTQDAEGCDRLIAAVNAIAADFSCILAVTHMPQFKEAFQTRIEVRKTQHGSQLSLSM